MGIKAMLEGFIMKIALKKAVKAAVGVVASAAILQQAGVDVDVARLETWLTSAGAAALAFGFNWLKVKTPLRKFL